jgi:hypothetical protein
MEGPMARIPGVESSQVPWYLRPVIGLIYWVTRRKVGKVLSSQKVAAHHPRLLLGRSAMEATLLGSHRVDDRLKTLAGIRAAMSVGCGH